MGQFSTLPSLAFGKVGFVLSAFALQCVKIAHCSVGKIFGCANYNAVCSRVTYNGTGLGEVAVDRVTRAPIYYRI